MVAATKGAYLMEQFRLGEVFKPYKCRWCAYYHVGHTKDRSMYNYNFPLDILVLLNEYIF